MAEILEDWMIRNLKRHGNCLIGRKFYERHFKEVILSDVRKLGFPDAYMRILSPEDEELKDIPKMPKKESGKVSEYRIIIETVKKRKVVNEMEKKKPGRPKKMKILTAAAPQQSSIDLKTSENEKPTEELVEVSKELAEEAHDEPVPTAETKTAYDMLLDCYDTLRKQMNVPELLTFFDIVEKDVNDSKMVLDQMYQMTIADLMDIRKSLMSR